MTEQQPDVLAEVDLSSVGLPPHSRMNQVRRKWMRDRLQADAVDLRKFGLNELADRLEEAANDIHDGKIVEMSKRSG